MKILFILITVLLISCYAYADRVYVEDKGVVIPIDFSEGDVKSVNNSDGTQT